jgi:hypothetical protein
VSTQSQLINNNNNNNNNNKQLQDDFQENNIFKFEKEAVGRTLC